MSDTDNKDGMTIEHLAGMMQREFVSKEERDAARFQQLQDTLDDHSDQLASLHQILSTEVSERDRMQKELDNHADHLGLTQKAA